MTTDTETESSEAILELASLGMAMNTVSIAAVATELIRQLKAEPDNIKLVAMARRAAMDIKEQVAAMEKVANDVQVEADRLLLAHYEKTEQKNVGFSFLSITFSEDSRAAYDPEKWNTIARWAVETGNEHIIQRRLTDAKVKDLVENGIALPEGLRLEPYTKISVRRK